MFKIPGVKKIIKARVNSLNFMIATAYLSENNEEQFLTYIHDLKNMEETKYFWISVYYLLQNNMEKFQINYEIYSSFDEGKNTYSDIIENLVKYKQHEDKQALETLKQLSPDIKNPLLKQIVSNYLN